jgi:hypothetical protein
MSSSASSDPIITINAAITKIHEELLHCLPVSAIIGLIFWREMFFMLDNESNLWSLPLDLKVEKKK